MEACKNKNSGRDFIYLEDRTHRKYLLITPSGTIKSLECELFEPPNIVTDDYASSSSITESQRNIYRMYIKSTEEELVERVEMYFEELTPQEQRNLLISLKQQL